MKQHLLWIDGVGALIEIDRHATTSGDYGQLYDAMKEQSGLVLDKFSHAEIVELDPQQYHAGVYWDWELCGPGGASYRIHILPGVGPVGPECVEACVDHIRHSFDCIRLIRNGIDRLIEFRMPEFKHVELSMRPETK